MERNLKFLQNYCLLFFLLFSSEILRAGDKRDILLSSYNGENLFDDQHDKDPHGKDYDDYNFLNCEEYKKNQHLITVKKFTRNFNQKIHAHECHNFNKQSVVRRVSQLEKLKNDLNPANKISFLFMQEVENKKMARLIMDAMEFDAFILADNSDARGSRQVFFFNRDSRIKKIEKIELSGILTYSTRPIFIIKLVFLDQPFVESEYYFVNLHLPSQRSPKRDRLKIIKSLSAYIKTHTSTNAFITNKALNRKKYWVISGDFNALEKEFENLIKPLTPFGIYDHSKSVDGLKSYYSTFDHQWLFFDRMLSNFNAQFNIVRKPEMLKKISHKKGRGYFSYTEKKVVPKRWNPRARNLNDLGFSDHLPVQLHWSLGINPKVNNW